MYCFELNNKAIEKMIYKRAAINLLDNEEHSPLHTIIQNYYPKSIDTLKKLGIDFRLIELLNKTQHISPLHAMLLEYKNHSFKFLGNNMKCKPKKIKYRDIMNFFTKNQYKEIEQMIYTNEKFGNNLMNNLNLSYEMAHYFIQKYIVICLRESTFLKV